LSRAGPAAARPFPVARLDTGPGRPLRIEPERDASLRGFELNASSVFAYGVWRPQYGIAINTAGTAPA